jgi:hypothetical protein
MGGGVEGKRWFDTVIMEEYGRSTESSEWNWLWVCVRFGSLVRYGRCGRESLERLFGGEA